jgi:hypothetical protein
MTDHPAITAVVFSTGLIAARLLSVSRFDVNTAATILQVSGTGTAVAGTALTLLPFALVLATCLLAVAVFLDNRVVHVDSRWPGVLLSLSIGAMLCLTALPLLLVTLAVVAAVAAGGRYVRRNHGEIDLAELVASSRLLRVQAMVLAVAVLLAPIVVQRPWLPTQIVRLQDGSVMVGYMLGEDSGRLALMSDRDRTVRFLDPDTIVDRAICSGPPTTGGVARRLPQVELRGSLIGTMLWGDQTPDYPDCPSP